MNFVSLLESRLLFNIFYNSFLFIHKAFQTLKLKVINLNTKEVVNVKLSGSVLYVKVIICLLHECTFKK